MGHFSASMLCFCHVDELESKPDPFPYDSASPFSKGTTGLGDKQAVKRECFHFSFHLLKQATEGCGERAAFAGREPHLLLSPLLPDAKQLSPRKGEKTEPAAARKNTLPFRTLALLTSKAVIPH